MSQLVFCPSLINKASFSTRVYCNKTSVEGYSRNRETKNKPEMIGVALTVTLHRRGPWFRPSLGYFEPGKDVCLISLGVSGIIGQWSDSAHRRKVTEVPKQSTSF